MIVILGREGALVNKAFKTLKELSSFLKVQVNKDYIPFIIDLDIEGNFKILVTDGDFSKENVVATENLKRFCRSRDFMMNTYLIKTSSGVVGRRIILEPLDRFFFGYKSILEVGKHPSEEE